MKNTFVQNAKRNKNDEHFTLIPMRQLQYIQYKTKRENKKCILQGWSIHLNQTDHHTSNAVSFSDCLSKKGSSNFVLTYTTQYTIYTVKYTV